MTKFQLTLEIIKTLGLCYEVGCQGPNKIGIAIERFASIESVFDVVHIQSELSCNEMAVRFLEFIYHGKPIPEWLERAEDILE
jgi:hypothetical protein